MRPLELRLRNFRSYFGDDVVIDFRGRGLVGVVGPIGSGKSTLLDAIAFALFGRTPTVAATTKSLIHQRADGATVSLRFSVDDEVWEVTRALRRKGQSVHGLAQLSGDDSEPARLETFVLESDVNGRIVELLGLEFDGFSRSIMLAQGRFAEFLGARPAERDKVLKGVFGHDRVDVMRAEAKMRSAAEANRAETLAVRLEAADAVAARIAETTERVALDEARLELLRKAEAKFADYKERLEATARVVSHTKARMAELEPMAARLPVAEVVAEVVNISKTAQATRTRLGSVLERAQVELAAADDGLTRMEPATMRSRIEEATRFEVILEQFRGQEGSLRKVLSAQERSAADAAKRLDSATVALTEASGVAQILRSNIEALNVAHDEATTALHRIQHENMAGTLRAALQAGDPCPVCDQPVAALPAEVVTPALSEAENDLKAAGLKLKVSQAEVAEVDKKVAELRESVSGIQAESKGVAKELAATHKQLDTLAKESGDASRKLTDLCGTTTIAALRTELRTAEVKVAEARKKVEMARGEHDEAIRSETSAGKELASLRLSLAEFAARLDLVLPPSEDVDSVVTAVRSVREAWTGTMETLATAKLAAEHESGEITAAHRELRLELEIDGEFETHLAETVATIDVRNEQIAADTILLAESDETRSNRDAALAHSALYDVLATELTDSRFVRYLLDEEKRALANLGSEHFERLSSGRYRFSGDGSFNIVDLTSADAVRKAESLSGGETFLASLALALALAEMVARTGGRLDAFFLDEGFGSLDPEHLDLAMEGIEQLAAGASDRLVIVVSHVPDMRHRMEDLIELDRNPVTGDTIVVHG